MSKPILCLDFDGVLHSYSSGWKGAAVIPDPPTDGAMLFLWQAAEHFTIAVFSSRSHQRGGRSAMRKWLTRHFREHWAADRTTCDDKLDAIQWPREKPPAFLSIDDRAIQFDGDWSALKPVEMLAFQPWNKRAGNPGVQDEALQRPNPQTLAEPREEPNPNPLPDAADASTRAIAAALALLRDYITASGGDEEHEAVLAQASGYADGHRAALNAACAEIERLGGKPS